MGSLTSRPKTPTAIVSQPVVYTTASTTSSSAATSTTDGTSQSASTIDTPAAPTDAEQQATARGAGLLDRRRGVLSTVVTGFRGLLTPQTAAPRKTLLGE